MAVGVDVGGTTVRLATVTRSGAIVPATLTRFDPQSRGPADEILRRFADALRCLDLAGTSGIGIGFPGPFDYERGICLLKGLGKYDALYGVDVGAALRRRLGLPDSYPVRFINDAAAFALGEAFYGAARPFRRAVVLTLGTGCGSAFLVEGKIVTEGEGVPPNGWVYPLLHQGKPLDDLLSTRGILALWRRLTVVSAAGRANGTGAEPTEVSSLAQRAASGDPLARRLFARFGRLLREAIAPILQGFRADGLVLGGRIALSFPLFASEAIEVLQAHGCRAHVVRAADIDHSALKGAASIAFSS